MSKKSNVHPDYYKTAGRDRPDDAARARLNRAIGAKATSQQHPDRMGKLYFERAEPAPPDFDTAADQPKAKTKAAARAGARKGAAPKTSRPKKSGARKSRTRAAGARKPAAPRRTTTTGKAGASRAKKSGKAAARPAKKR